MFREEEGENAKNVELMIKKRSSEMLADEKTFLGNVTRKNVTCEISLGSVKKL